MGQIANCQYVCDAINQRKNSEFYPVTGTDRQVANMEYLLKMVDKANEYTTSYGTGQYATKQVIDTNAVISIVNNDSLCPLPHWEYERHTVGTVSFICSRRGVLNVICVGGGQGGGGEGGSLQNGAKSYGGRGGDGGSTYIRVNGIQQILATGGNSEGMGGWGGPSNANGGNGYKGSNGQTVPGIIDLQKNDIVVICVGGGGGGGDGGNGKTNGNPGSNGTDTSNGATGGGVYQGTAGSNGNGTNNGIGGNPGTWSVSGGQGGKCGKILLSGTAQLSLM